MQQVHILNGDALQSHLPKAIEGSIIIARECLIDGAIQANNLTEFYAVRSQFISEYFDCNATDYYLKTVPEIEKIRQIAPGIDIYCWFEHDLFCQCNFWFVIFMLAKKQASNKIYFVSPNSGNEYSFAAMSEHELTQAFTNSQLLRADDINLLAQLWPLYQKQNYQVMTDIARQMSNQMPWLVAAIEAQQARMPDESGYGRPERLLLSVIDELNTEEFAPVFRRFCQLSSIYSFGDLQVKQILDKLIAQKKQ